MITPPKPNMVHLKSTPLKRKLIFYPPPFWGSMLVLGGVIIEVVNWQNVAGCLKVKLIFVRSRAERREVLPKCFQTHRCKHVHVRVFN